MKLSFEKKLNFTFLLVFLVLFSTMYYANKSSHKNSYFWVDHTHLVLHKTSEVSIILKEITNAKLKVLIAPFGNTVSSYDSLKKILNTKVNELKDLTKDNLSQQVTIDELINLLKSSYTYSDNNSNFSNTSKTNLFSLNEKNVLVKIDKIIEKIEDQENMLMIIRQQKNATSFAYFNRRFYLLFSLVTVLFTIVYFIIKNSQQNANKFNKELLSANQRITNIIESVSDPLFVLDRNSRFIYINSAAANRPGFNTQNLIGQKLNDRIKQFDDELLETKISEASITQLPITYQTFNKDLNHWYDITVYPNKEGFTIYEKNITQRKISENELLKTKKLLEETNEIALIGGWELDLINNVLNWTLITRKILEVSPEYMTDLETALKFYKEGETRDRITRVINEAIETGKPFSEELQLISAKGNQRWVMAEGKADFINGKCTRVYGIFQDFTEEKKLKDELKLKEEQFTNAFKYSATGITIISLEGLIMDANESFCKMFGFNKDELLNSNIKNITYPPDFSVGMDKIIGVINGDFDSFQVEKRYTHKDGSIVWGSLNASIIKDRIGNFLHIISHVIDITEKKNAEQDLQNSEQKFKELFQFLPVGIALVDLETSKYLEINDMLLTISGFTKEEFVLQSSLERTPAAYHAQDKKELEKLMQTGHCGPYTKKSIKKNGEIYSILVEAIKFINSNGKSLMLAVVQDITEIESKEQQLTDLNNLLQKTNANLATINSEQAQFTYIVSHDLKEPLRMIVGFMDLLQKKYVAQLDENANKYIDLAIDGGRRMQKMIGDLLLYSSTGKNEKGRENIELGEIIKEVELNLYKQIKELDATIIFDNEDCKLRVYRSEILRLFQNLISNAIKFHKKEVNPIIHICCKEEENHWLIEIKDNGIGIDINNQERIFEVFTRLHAVNEYEGTGIGLAICKKIVKQHKGTIWVESVADIGSTFYFTLSK